MVVVFDVLDLSYRYTAAYDEAYQYDDVCYDFHVVVFCWFIVFFSMMIVVKFLVRGSWLVETNQYAYLH